LKREADHDRADGGRGEQLLAQHHRADDREQHDDQEILDDRGKTIRGAILPPRVGDDGDDGVDDRENEREAGERRQELDVTQPLLGENLEKREAENQPG
jgi:hypothetical protein